MWRRERKAERSIFPNFVKKKLLGKYPITKIYGIAQSEIMTGDLFRKKE